MTDAPRCPNCTAGMVAGARYEPDATVSVLLCLVCGTEMPPFGTCCARTPRPTTRSTIERACEHCEVAFRLRYPSNPARFCSPACAHASRRVDYVRVTCPCGAEFATPPSLHKPNPTTGHRRGIYCSKSCAARFWKRRAA